MRRAIRWAWLVFLAAIMTVLPPAWGAPPAAPDTAAQTLSAGYLENVTFEKLQGKERVTLTVSKQSGVTVENQPGNAESVRDVSRTVERQLATPARGELGCGWRSGLRVQFLLTASPVQ